MELNKTILNQTKYPEIDFSDLSHRDFFVLSLNQEDTYERTDIAEDKLNSIFTKKDIWLIIRQDLQRLYVWMGPTCPVRKKFLATQIATEVKGKLKDNNGRNLKIVAINAGDEPTEFLAAFNLESFVVTERLSDMQSLRNTAPPKVNRYMGDLSPDQMRIAKEEMMTTPEKVRNQSTNSSDESIEDLNQRFAAGEITKQYLVHETMKIMRGEK